VEDHYLLALLALKVVWVGTQLRHISSEWLILMAFQ
jgi:hypothetical protein